MAAMRRVQRIGEAAAQGATVIAALLTAGAVAAQSTAHVHGTLRVDVAVDADSVSLQLEAPLDSLLGFERAPRTDVERRAADALRGQLMQTTALFGLDAGAGCVAQPATVTSALLDGAAKADDHADVQASYLLRCRQPGVLKVIDLNGLMSAFPRVQRLDVQMATPGGQWKQTLKRPQSMLRLTR